MAKPIETTKPTVITQAMTENGPMRRLDREEESVANAQDSAAPRPPTIAITARSLTGRLRQDRVRPLLPSAPVPGARPASARPTIAREGFRLGQNAPEVEGRPQPVRPQASSQRRAARGDPRPAPVR